MVVHLSSTLRVGTRPSVMARVQAETVAAALRVLVPKLDVEVVPISTTGDRWQGPLAEVGGKGVYVRELDAAQQARGIDIAVHCLKDVPSVIADGLTVAAYRPRDEVRDALVVRDGFVAADLSPGSRVGTSAPRRTAQLRRHWPHLEVVALRGNADSRLARLASGQLDALVLSAAGLQRIGQADQITDILPIETMLPAVGAGIVVVTTLDVPGEIRDLVAQLDDPPTREVATAERVMLAALDGNCSSPIAGHASSETDGTLRLAGAVFSADGEICLEAGALGDDPVALGTEVATALVDKGARLVIEAAADDKLKN